MSGRTTVPQHPGKHDAPAVLAATGHLERLDRSFPPPDAVVLAFRSSLVAAVARRTERRHAFAGGNLYVLPGTASASWGTSASARRSPPRSWSTSRNSAWRRSPYSTGAGGLQPDLDGGEALVIESAIRDEGVSHHYLEPARTVAVTPALVEGFERELAAVPVRYRVGTTWTTDAIFRETVPEVGRYAAEGVLAAEMEVATVLAVAAFHGLDAGAVLAAFDALRGEEWVLRLEGERRLERLPSPVVDALVAHTA